MGAGLLRGVRIGPGCEAIPGFGVVLLDDGVLCRVVDRGLFNGLAKFIIVYASLLNGIDLIRISFLNTIIDLATNLLMMIIL